MLTTTSGLCTAVEHTRAWCTCGDSPSLVSHFQNRGTTDANTHRTQESLGDGQHLYPQQKALGPCPVKVSSILG